MGAGGKVRRRGGADVGDQKRVRALKTLIARERRVQDRLRAGVVIAQERRQHVWRRNAHAVEQRQRRVGMAEHAQHRQHAVNRAYQLRRRGDVARRIGLAQRQKIKQQVDQGLRITPDMAAVGQDLGLQFFVKPFAGALEQAAITIRTKRRLRQRNRSEQPRLSG